MFVAIYQFYIIGEAPQQCPKDFPFPFQYGTSCCKHAKDKQENPLSIRSQTCFYDAYRPCIKDGCVENSK